MPLVLESWSIDGLREGFRGGGQNFQLTIQPGTELFRYSLNFEEPRVFDTEWGFRTNLTWQERRIRQIESRRATVGGSEVRQQLECFIQPPKRRGGDWPSDSVPIEYFLDGERSTVNGVGFRFVMRR